MKIAFDVNAQLPLKYGLNIKGAVKKKKKKKASEVSCCIRLL